MASFKKLLLTNVHPKKAASGPSSMRSYRVESALSMRLGPQQGKEVATETAEAPRPTARLVTAERDRSVRVQQQWVVSLVVIIAMLALLAGLYLNITASASIAGRQIQSLEAEITAHEQVNADLETRIATLMANAILEERAIAMGFMPVERKSLQYMVVPGYFPPQAVNMISAKNPDAVISSSPEFNETLLEWLAKQIQAASIPLAESKR